MHIPVHNLSLQNQNELDFSFYHVFTYYTLSAFETWRDATSDRLHMQSMKSYITSNFEVGQNAEL